MRRFEMVLLIIIVALGFIVRLYRIGNPIADWHAWRQADTSSVSRNFVKNGFDLLHPKFNDISNVASGFDNPAGYRFVEFPVYNFFQAVLYTFIGGLTLEEWGRMVSIISSVFSILFLYLIVKQYGNRLEALLSSFFFAFLPFSVYYGRTILPDEMMVTAILGGTYFFSKWLNTHAAYNSGLKIKRYIFFVLSVIFTAGSFLLKPYALFFTLPIIFLAFEKFRFSLLKKWQLWVFLILSVTPLLVWRLWMSQYPAGIPVSGWLFNANNIRFKGAFFYWIFADRIARLISGYFGIVLIVLGLFKRQEGKMFELTLAFLASSLAYIVIIAGGNVQHDYYQILIIPTVSLLMARGSLYLFHMTGTNKIVAGIIFPLLVLGSLSFSWYFVRDYFNINNISIVEAGVEADRILPRDAKVIAPYNGDTSFLYYTNRNGWPILQKPIHQMIDTGASYLVIAKPTQNDFSGFGKQYQIVASSSAYLILKLTK